MSKRKIWISYENEFTKLKIDPVLVEDIDDLRNEIVKHLQLNCPVVNVKLKRGGVHLLDPSAAIPQGFTTTGDALHVYVSSAEQKNKKQKKAGQALNEEQKKLQVEEQKKLQERKTCLDTDAKNLEISQRKERSLRKQYKSEMDTLLSHIRVLHDSEKRLKDQIRNLQRAWRPNESKEGNTECEAERESELVMIEGPVAAAPGGPPAASASKTKKKKKKKKRNKKHSRNSTKGEDAGTALCEQKFLGVSDTDMQINELHKQREELKIKRAALFKQYNGVKQVDHAIATKLSSLSSQMRGVEQELKNINLKLQV